MPHVDNPRKCNVVSLVRNKSFNYKPTHKDDVMVTPRSLWHYVSNFYALDQKRYRMVYANYDEALLPMNMYLGLKSLWFNQTTHIHVIEVKTI